MNRRMTTMNAFLQTVQKSRKRLLQMHFESGVGHIGGNLSCLDILLTLFHRTMSPDDALVLSKGHAAGALYTALWSKCKLSDDDLKTFHKDATKLSGHPSPGHLPEIPFATGSLGHGLSLSNGISLGKRLQNQPGNVFCMMSDGEWQEGSNWEALLFARHRNLNITLIIDTNGLQGFGTTKAIASQDSFFASFQALGIEAIEVDGHDLETVDSALMRKRSGLRAVIAKTRKGNGVSFMENRMEWHYKPMNEAEYAQAIRELDSASRERRLKIITPGKIEIPEKIAA